MKKIVKYGIGAAVTGGVIAGITIPVVHAVNNKEDVIKHIDMTQEAWHGMTLQQLVDGVKHEEEVSGSILTDVSKASTFILYDKEQVGSVELQKKHFDFKLFQIRVERADLKTEYDDAATTSARKKQIEDRRKVLDTEFDKTTDNKTKLDSLTKADYESSSFSSTFPHVLLTREVIQDKQTKIYDDNKKAFVSQFSTEAEGDAAWIDEQKKKYNGAKDDNEAIAMLVYGIIKNNAYAKYNYILNGEFTREMKDATYPAKADGTKDKIFEFLKDASQKMMPEDPGTPAEKASATGTKDDKVYFISTKSRIIKEIPVDVTASNQKIIDMAGKKLTHISHALIPVKQNLAGATLPWDVTKEDLIGGGKDKTGAGFISLYGSPSQSFIESLPGLFDKKDTTANSADIEKDNFFIEHALSQPTANKDGSLGVKEKINTIKGMAPGFKIGLVEAMKALKDNPSSPTTEGDGIITKIVTDIKAIMTAKSITTQSQLVAYINSLSKDEVTTTFGGIFRDAFNTTPKLYYILSDHSFIVRSSFGIHFIKLEDFSQPQTLVDQIIKDTQEAADEQSTGGVIINYTQLFSQFATTDKVVEELMGDSTTNALLKAGYERTTKNGEEISDQTKKDASDNDVPMNWAEVEASVTKAIANVVASRDLNTVMSALGNDIKKYLEEKLDAGLIDSHDGSSTTTMITAEKIYKDAQDLMK